MRDFLKGLDLDKETIDTIMAEHGKLITEEKEKNNSASVELKNTKELLDKANKEIDGYKSINVEELQNKIKAYEVEKKEMEDKHSKEIGDMKYQRAIEIALDKEEFSSEYAKKGVIDDIMKKGLKLEESGKIVGVEEVLKEIRTNQPGAFKEVKKEGEDGKITPPPMYAGAGKDPITPTEADSIKQSYKTAVEKKNTTEMVRIMRVAQEKGIKVE